MNSILIAHRGEIRVLKRLKSALLLASLLITSSQFRYFSYKVILSLANRDNAILSDL